jgi:predicted metalloprotease
MNLIITEEKARMFRLEKCGSTIKRKFMEFFNNKINNDGKLDKFCEEHDKELREELINWVKKQSQ